MKKGAAVGDSDDSDIDDEDDSDDEAGGGMLLSDILTANLRDEAASKVSAGTRRRPCAAVLLLTHVRHGFAQGSASQASAAAQSLAAAAASRGRSNSGVSGDDSSESDVDSALESSGEEEAGVGDHAKLLSMVDDLAPATHTRVKRKGPARVQEVSEPLAEAEYNLAPDRGGLGGGLTLDALVGSLKDTTQYGGLKKKLSALDKGPVRCSLAVVVSLPHLCVTCGAWADGATRRVPRRLLCKPPPAAWWRSEPRARCSTN